jgi:hypothetical protein
MRAANIAAGLFLSVLSLALIFWIIPGQSGEGGSVSYGTSPEFLPILAASAILLFSSVLVVQQLVGFSPASNRPNPFAGMRWWRVLGGAATALGGALLMSFVGDIVALPAILLAGAWLFGERRPLVLIIFPLLATAAIYGIFEKLFEASLP